MNYILNSPAYWFNDLIRIVAIELIPNNYQINNSALLSHVYNSNDLIRNSALHKLKQIDINKNYVNEYSLQNYSRSLLIEFDLIKEKFKINDLDENLIFQLFCKGSLVRKLSSEEIEMLNTERHVLFLLNGNIKLPFKNYEAEDVLNLTTQHLFEKNMFSSDVIYFKILHKNILPFIMSSPSLAEQIVFNK